MELETKSSASQEGRVAVAANNRLSAYATCSLRLLLPIA
jgi:hypothetical protein